MATSSAAKWPEPLDFALAIQNPHFCFQDPELQGSHPKINSLGLPHMITGNFAGVCEMQNGTHRWAVRCFLRQVSDQQRRYGIISQHLKNLKLPVLVDFEYRPQGIRVGRQWYPIVKMEWVEGESLSAFIEKHLNNPSMMMRLAQQWRSLVVPLLRGLHVAHGDLQHGNMLVTPNEQIKLVDYDGMFVPQLKGEKSPEKGHLNFAHPKRTADHYDETLDNFPALVIYLSLVALANEPGLWRQFNTGENLILSAPDYKNPHQSAVIQRLKNSPDSSIRYLANCLERYSQGSLAQVPDLETILLSAPSPASKPTQPSTPISSNPTSVHSQAQAFPSSSSSPPVTNPQTAPWWKSAQTVSFPTPTTPKRPQQSPSPSFPSFSSSLAKAFALTLQFLIKTFPPLLHRIWNCIILGHKQAKEILSYVLKVSAIAWRVTAQIFSQVRKQMNPSSVRLPKLNSIRSHPLVWSVAILVLVVGAAVWSLRQGELEALDKTNEPTKAPSAEPPREGARQAEESKSSSPVMRGWVGLAIQSVTPELAKVFGLEQPTGALVADVDKGGPADKAGIIHGDIITSFDGTPIRTMQQLVMLTVWFTVRDKVNITALRNGKNQNFTVTLGESNDKLAMAGAEIHGSTFNESEGQNRQLHAKIPPTKSPEEVARKAEELKASSKFKRGWVGVFIETATGTTTIQLEKNFVLKEPVGALVTKVTKGGPADKAGLIRGDIITRFDGIPIITSQALTERAESVAVGDKVNITVLRNRKKRTFTVTLGESPEDIATTEGARRGLLSNDSANQNPQQRAKIPPAESPEEVARKVEERKSQQVTELLARAQNQRKADRLVSPRGTNALETYREVLKILPDNTEAKAGLQEITEQLKQSGQAALQQGKWAEAQEHYEAALKVDPQADALRTALRQVKKAQKESEESAGRYETTVQAHILEEPRSDATVVASLPPGKRVTVVGAVGDYLRVESRKGNLPGYIARQDVTRYREESEPLETSQPEATQSLPTEETQQQLKEEKSLRLASTIVDGKQVSLQFTLRLADKTQVDSNIGKEPLVYTQGAHQIIPGLEKSLVGMKVGETKRIEVFPEEGYGLVDSSRTREVAKDTIPETALKVGSKLKRQSRNGQTIFAEVKEIRDRTVILDMNHPLAGKRLIFNVKVLKIEDAPKTATSQPAPLSFQP